jgi:hypothetical protein
MWPSRLFLCSCLISALGAGPVGGTLETRLTPAAQAREDGRRVFAIAAGDGAVALERFAEQSRTAVIYLVQQVRGVRTNAVRGEFTPREALVRIVANTGLVVAHDEHTGALMVKPAPKKPGPGAAP